MCDFLFCIIIRRVLKITLFKSFSLCLCLYIQRKLKLEFIKETLDVPIFFSQTKQMNKYSQFQHPKYVWNKFTMRISQVMTALNVTTALNLCSNVLKLNKQIPQAV